MVGRRRWGRGSLIGMRSHHVAESPRRLGMSVPHSTGRISLGIHWYSHLKKFRIVLEVYKYLFGASSIGQCFSLPLSYPGKLKATVSI
uniref:Uncharacterized protein n=2 Tax=Oryza sativa subsp. japonica TaxID=39947 RepID=Q2R828_ORYSJ|nr:hypothetical protein LOC_Os11g14100 [Oryza sativa Japonica Group]ABA92401.1 hypothetical protein LOC_Os11g14100 [Oryza sativa Japonica Group]